jgi:hypothetical protein
MISATACSTLSRENLRAGRVVEVAGTRPRLRIQHVQNVLFPRREAAKAMQFASYVAQLVFQAVDPLLQGRDREKTDRPFPRRFDR